MHVEISRSDDSQDGGQEGQDNQRNEILVLPPLDLETLPRSPPRAFDAARFSRRTSLFAALSAWAWRAYRQDTARVPTMCRRSDRSTGEQRARSCRAGLRRPRWDNAGESSSPRCGPSGVERPARYDERTSGPPSPRRTRSSPRSASADELLRLDPSAPRVWWRSEGRMYWVMVIISQPARSGRAVGGDFIRALRPCPGSLSS